jgi:NTE family protein
MARIVHAALQTPCRTAGARARDNPRPLPLIKPPTTGMFPRTPPIPERGALTGRRRLPLLAVGLAGMMLGAGLAQAQGVTGAAGAAPMTAPVTAPITAAPAPPAADAAAPQRRPRVGLVLGGGGARGAAHIGVLEVLEQLRVPVDCIAGTSMGALVAGAWAAGVSPAEMREVLGRANWSDMFFDNPDYSELNFRNKRLLQRFLPGTETGVTAGGVTVPPGVVTGQKVKLFINQLVRADVGERLIEQLPLPLSIIATDIGTGERVAYRDGSLTQAMRASMAVPGLLAPVDDGERKLVDGGLVDNVPIAEVRERCGAELVIAVNVGSPLLRPEQIGGLLSISAQMVALLTEQNVTRSLATLTATDIYLQPDLGDITAASFERHAEAADRGRAAAEAVAGRLATLAVGDAAFAAWRHRLEGRDRPVPRVDAVEIAGLSRVNPQVVQRYLRQRPGEPLDTEALNRDLLRAYGDGHYASVDYTLLTVRERHVLRIAPVEKPWGPDYLRMSLTLESTFSQGSTYQLRAGYQKTWINRLGGELLFTGEVGSSTGAAAEWYQPLDAGQQWFADVQVGYRRERQDVYFNGQRIAEYRLARSTAELSAGRSFSLLGQLRAGWRETYVDATLETGLPLLPLPDERRTGGWLLALEMDQLNALYFPSRGWAVRAELFDSPQRAYSRLDVDLRGAVPWGDHVLGGRLAMVRSLSGRLPADNAARLGGFLNLTGYANGQLVGDSVQYAQLRAARIVGRLPLGLRGDMRLGVALEAGKVGRPYTQQRRTGWLGSAALYAGGETPIGAVYIGLGRAAGGATNAYLFVGTP